MTKAQKEKIIELRKLGIGYRSIATAMDLSRDSVRIFVRVTGWMTMARITRSQKAAQRHISHQNVKKTGKIKIRSCINMCAITVGQSLKTKQRMVITVAEDVTFEIGSGEMKT